MLFYVGDILAVYGVLLSLGVWLFWRDRWLVGCGRLFLVLNALPGGGAPRGARGPAGGQLPATPVGHDTERLPAQRFIMLLGPIGFACPFLLGLWAGRRRILERPARHRRLLGVVAAGGIGAAVLAHSRSRWWWPARARGGRFPAGARPAHGDRHARRGRLRRRDRAARRAAGALPGRGVTALAATGQRSMTCYLAQSVVWAVVFTPFLLGLVRPADRRGDRAAGGRDVGGDGRARRSDGGPGRGPFEVLLRRATYGRG